MAETDRFAHFPAAILAFALVTPASCATENQSGGDDDDSCGGDAD